MQFKFKELEPSAEAIKIIEAFETVGFVITLQGEEIVQWENQAEEISLNATQGKARTNFRLAKSYFTRKNFKYHKWMPREDYEAWVKINPSFNRCDCILAKRKEFLYSYEDTKARTSGNINNYKLAFYCVKDNVWYTKIDERLENIEYYDYVALITE